MLRKENPIQSSMEGRFPGGIAVGNWTNLSTQQRLHFDLPRPIMNFMKSLTM